MQEAGAIISDAGDAAAQVDPDAAAVVTETPTWFDALPEHLKTNEFVKEHKSGESLADSYVQLKGEAPVKPESPEAYQFDVPEDVTLDEEGMKGFRKIAFDMGLTNEQAAKLVEFDITRIRQIQKDHEEGVAKTIEEEKAKIKTEWGDTYEENVKLADRAIETFGGEDLVKWLTESELKHFPLLLKFAHKVGKAMSESTLAPDVIPKKGQETDAFGRPALDFSKSMPDK